jgi:hypothetical protein
MHYPPGTVIPGGKAGPRTRAKVPRCNRRSVQVPNPPRDPGPLLRPDIPHLAIDPRDYVAVPKRGLPAEPLGVGFRASFRST